MNFQKGFSTLIIVFTFALLLFGGVAIFLYTNDIEKTDLSSTDLQKEGEKIGLDNIDNKDYIMTCLEENNFLTTLSCYMEGDACKEFEAMEISKNTSLRDKRVTQVKQSGQYFAIRAEDADYVPFCKNAQEQKVSIYVGDENNLKVVGIEDNRADVMSVDTIEYSEDINRILLTTQGGAEVHRVYLIDPKTFEQIAFKDPDSEAGTAILGMEQGYFNGYYQIKDGKIHLSYESVMGDMISFTVDPKTGYVEN